jgi:hypothetical protein
MKSDLRLCRPAVARQRGVGSLGDNLGSPLMTTFVGMEAMRWPASSVKAQGETVEHAGPSQSLSNRRTSESW